MERQRQLPEPVKEALAVDWAKAELAIFEVERIANVARSGCGGDGN